MPEHAAVRTRTAPVHPRRVSGPSRRLAPAVAVPRGRTGAFERISRIPDYRAVDRVLRSRGCIWLIGLLLGGIVAMQVSLLRLNSGISRAVQTQSTLEKQNMGLQSAIAEMTSADRVTAAAAGGLMIDPPAGQTRYLTVRDGDAARAIRRYKPPSDRAKAIMANNGMLPGALAEPGSAAAQLAASLNAGTAAAGATPNTTTTPTATATPPATTSQVQPVATPIATPTPIATAVPTTTPAVTTDPATGAATAPQG
jgi:hypothetical protein